MNTDNACLVVRRQATVAAVQRAGDFAKIAPPVVQAVSVFMIDILRPATFHHQKDQATSLLRTKKRHHNMTVTNISGLFSSKTTIPAVATLLRSACHDD